MIPESNQVTQPVNEELVVDRIRKAIRWNPVFRYRNRGTFHYRIEVCPQCHHIAQLIINPDTEPYIETDPEVVSAILYIHQGMCMHSAGVDLPPCAGEALVLQHEGEDPDGRYWPWQVVMCTCKKGVADEIAG